ncbi:MAG: serine--tRNA ligase [Candidatus Nanoarchaeia archaeon]|nr:serine--tRNA ligase [Candidatus Nanoarchaeia archaeon]
MLDIRFVKENSDVVKESIKKRFKQAKLSLVDDSIGLYDQWLKLKKESDDLRAQRNKVSEEINKLQKSGKDIKEKVKEIKQIPEKIKQIEEKQNELHTNLNKTLKQIPNLLHSSVPIGEDESKNKILRTFGTKTKFSFLPKSHTDIIENLELVELERAAKVSGARFYYIKDELVELEWALIKFAMDYLKKKGFTLIRTPNMARSEAIEGAAELGDFNETLYGIKDEDLFLVATAEHTLASLHMNEMLTCELPYKYAGISECFRKEAGAHGKDQKGIFRVHEFRKVEQFIYSNPKDSYKHMEEIVKNAEELFKKLKLPYRVVNIASGALNDTAAKKCDIEIWMPAQKEYRELVSVSNCLDYQSRKLGIRFKGKDGTFHPHLINGTAIATPRILVAIIENFQQKDGSIKIPAVLHKYLGFKKISPKKKPHSKR